MPVELHGLWINLAEEWSDFSM